jgi:hypothetical protein
VRDSAITRGDRIISAKGDSVLAEFISAVAAVESAVAIQNGVAARSRAHSAFTDSCRLHGLVAL